MGSGSVPSSITWNNKWTYSWNANGFYNWKERDEHYRPRLNEQNIVYVERKYWEQMFCCTYVTRNKYRFVCVGYFLCVCVLFSGPHCFPLFCIAVCIVFNCKCCYLCSTSEITSKLPRFSSFDAMRSFDGEKLNFSEGMKTTHRKVKCTQTKDSFYSLRRLRLGLGLRISIFSIMYSE